MDDVEKAKFLLDGDLVKAKLLGECYLLKVRREMFSPMHTSIIGEVTFDYLDYDFDSRSKKLALIEIED